ncbi:hypothetical protein [Acidipropionibacterium timonense]|uniref:hypothetical protein n=1 Tax=Acidipropionibacterium timonense TaxID=2161818 RepID=UPI001030BF8D|nr:hypothetical protein [Acidipropionibacterium timonense]
MKRAVAGVVLAGSLALTGCSGAIGGVDASPTPSPSFVASSPRTASWATKVVTTGTHLGVLSDSRVRIDVYQVGLTRSPSPSVMVDPRTGKSVVAKGDQLVVLRYVVTNVSTDTLKLGLGTVTVTTRYPDWGWAQDLLSVRYPSVEAKDGAPGTPFRADPGRPPYALGSGESFMVGQIVPYEEAEELKVSARVVVSDDSGTPDSGLSWTVSGSVHLS